jgi:site-specific DNA-methyltransferase (adenine-specific)
VALARRRKARQDAAAPNPDAKDPETCARARETLVDQLEAAAVWMPLGELAPWDSNPRQNDEAAPDVARSLIRFGWGAPLVAWSPEDGSPVRRIIGGHTRRKAVLLLPELWKRATDRERETWHPQAVRTLETGLVPVRIRTDLSEREANLYAIADNKLGEKADWDEKLLASVLSEFSLEEVAIAGFDESELEKLGTGILSGAGGGEDGPIIEDDAPDKPKEAVTQPGDIWILGEHRLLCGDARDAAAFERLMAGAKARLIVTDPPYNVAYVGKTKDAKTIQNDSMSDEQFRGFLNEAVARMFEASDPGSAFYIWHADTEGYNFRGAVRDNGERERECLIWNKNVLVMGRQDYHWKHEPCLYGWIGGAPHRWYSDRKQTTVLDFDRPSRSEEHPTMKPVSLIAYLIRNSSQRGELVLDPFLGSGTTLIAAEQTGRRCYGMELDPLYCDVIVQRWEKLTGRQAVRESA